MSDDTLGKHPKRPQPPRTFTRAFELGSAGDPAGGLVADPAGRLVSPDHILAWLRAQTRLVRVPVVMRREPIWPGFSRRGARIGTLELDLDDTRLGIAIDDHARRSGGDAPTCALWLEGRLGAHEDDDAPTFEIVKFHRAIAPDEDATFIELEVDGPAA